MLNTQLDADRSDGAFWLVQESASRITGVVGLIDVEIYGCRLQRIGLAAGAADMPALRASFG